MKTQDWIFSVRYGFDPRDVFKRHAVVGPARASTVEAALHLAGVPEDVRAEIRGCDVVRDFVEGKLDPTRSGYHAISKTHAEEDDSDAWHVGIGSVTEVLGR